VSQVLDFRAEDVGEPPPFGTRIRVDYIVGMGKIGKKFVHILDIDGVLSAAELMAVTSAAGAEPAAEVSGASSEAASPADAP
jgi:purine-binding chemotaxis protein CheW